MTMWQKAIKYAAIAFAVFLIASILTGILGTVGIFSGLSAMDATNAETQTYAVAEDITSLSIDVNAADIHIESGRKFSVESNLKELTVTDENGVLKIREKAKQVFGKNYTAPILKIEIPTDATLKSAKISTGAGRLDVAYLHADKISLELGAGEVTIRNLQSSSATEISGGAGAITIQDGILNDLDLDMGVGELKLTAQLLGSSELELGVGQSTLVLLGDPQDYTLDVDKGIGSVAVEGTQKQGDGQWGTGENRVSIDGGLGQVNVSVKSSTNPDAN